ncbi:hypothetical protein N8630_00105 [Synechococcus sp. AH-601-C19]|nr:hypothetical protein [Synechococcus sp. AH-601-C19]
MDLYYRKSKRKQILNFFWIAINGINAILLSTYSAVAQTNLSPIERLPLSDLTNFTLQNLVGPRFEVNLPDGTSCVSQDGTPTTINVYGGSSERNDEAGTYSGIRQDYSGSGNGYALGAAITIPLFTRNSRNCDKAYELSIAAKKIELATLLHQEGLLSDDDLDILLGEVKKILLTK